VCAGLVHLGLERLVVSPVAVGSGRITGAHGTMPVPPPAVAELLRGAPSYAGGVAMELCTPPGAALLTTHATSYGPQPPMTVTTIGVGAGGRDPQGHANVLRLFVGEPAATAPVTGPLLVETNVDDLDPRLWPNVIAALLAAGASDAWLTPILMKKGRPAHTLSVLVRGDLADAVRAEIFRQTSTIGLREIPLGKTALDREMRTVAVSGGTVRVKIARHEGVVVNVQPEYDDVSAVATANGRPIKDVLAEAVAASRTFHER
ncbi:MAG: nickel pincer cofactor biosynthesis protein LarC2, partial [Nocardioidaceae bacterium]